MAEYVWIDSVGATRSKSRVSFYRPLSLSAICNPPSVIQSSAATDGSVALHATPPPPSLTLTWTLSSTMEGRARLVPPRPHTTHTHDTWIPATAKSAALVAQNKSDCATEGHFSLRCFGAVLCATSPNVALLALVWLWPSNATQPRFRSRRPRPFDSSSSTPQFGLTGRPLRSQHENHAVMRRQPLNRLG